VTSRVGRVVNVDVGGNQLIVPVTVGVSVTVGVVVDVACAASGAGSGRQALRRNGIRRMHDRHILLILAKRSSRTRLDISLDRDHLITFRANRHRTDGHAANFRQPPDIDLRRRRQFVPRPRVRDALFPPWKLFIHRLER